MAQGVGQNDTEIFGRFSEVVAPDFDVQGERCLARRKSDVARWDGIGRKVRRSDAIACRQAEPEGDHAVDVATADQSHAEVGGGACSTFIEGLGGTVLNHNPGGHDHACDGVGNGLRQGGESLTCRYNQQRRLSAQPFGIGLQGIAHRALRRTLHLDGVLQQRDGFGRSGRGACNCMDGGVGTGQHIAQIVDLGGLARDAFVRCNPCEHTLHECGIGQLGAEHGVGRQQAGHFLNQADAVVLTQAQCGRLRQTRIFEVLQEHGAHIHDVGQLQCHLLIRNRLRTGIRRCCGFSGSPEWVVCTQHGAGVVGNTPRFAKQGVSCPLLRLGQGAR